MGPHDLSDPSGFWKTGLCSSRRRFDCREEQLILNKRINDQLQQEIERRGQVERELADSERKYGKWSKRRMILYI